MSRLTSDRMREAYDALRQKQRDQSAKCAAPPCRHRVAYAGDFCRQCLNVQAEMRRQLRARTK